jgi:hypothetical protein
MFQVSSPNVRLKLSLTEEQWRIFSGPTAREQEINGRFDPLLTSHAYVAAHLPHILVRLPGQEMVRRVSYSWQLLLK